jgi:hypothetical protein
MPRWMPSRSDIGLYTLIGRLPVPCDDPIAWSEWLARDGVKARRVGRDQIGPMLVSTVFLGLDHSHGGDNPMLFETMVFGDEEDSYQTRCETWEEAEAMHKHAVEVATGMLERAESSLKQFAHLFEEPKA